MDHDFGSKPHSGVTVMSDQDQLQEAAARIDAHVDYRLLRRIPPSTEWQLPAAQGKSRRGLFVDVETTGLDTETDEVIEVALLPFDYDPATGDVIAVHHVWSKPRHREKSFRVRRHASSRCVPRKGSS